jgi:hypothetical protein
MSRVMQLASLRHSCPVRGAPAGVAGAISADTLANYTDYGRAGSGSSSHHHHHQGGGSAYGQGGYGGAPSASYGNGSQFSAAVPSSPYAQGAYAAAPQAHPQQQLQPQASLIDAVPHSQPAYPYYQHGMAAPQVGACAGSIYCRQLTRLRHHTHASSLGLCCRVRPCQHSLHPPHLAHTIPCPACCVPL